MRIQPIAATEKTVTLARDDFQELLDLVEDAADISAVREMEARLAEGETEEIPFEMVNRVIAGDHPVRVLREHRGLTHAQLSAASTVGTSYVGEIEAGKKPGSFDAMTKIARAAGKPGRLGAARAWLGHPEVIR